MLYFFKKRRHVKKWDSWSQDFTVKSHKLNIHAVRWNWISRIWPLLITSSTDAIVSHRIIAMASESISTVFSQHCNYIVSVSAQKPLGVTGHSVPAKGLTVSFKAYRPWPLSFLWLAPTLPPLLMPPGPTGLLVASQTHQVHRHHTLFTLVDKFIAQMSFSFFLSFFQIILS